MYWFLKFCERELWDPTLKLLAELAEQPGAELVKTNRHNWRHSRRRPCSRLSQFKRYIERMRPTGAGNIHFPLQSICTYCRMSGEFVRKGQELRQWHCSLSSLLKLMSLCKGQSISVMSYYRSAFAFDVKWHWSLGGEQQSRQGVTRNISLICEGLLKLGPSPFLHIWWYWINVESREQGSKSISDTW